MHMNISRMSEIDYRITVMQKITRMHKICSGNRGSLRAEMRVELAEF